MFHGSIVALVTPMKEDGAIDFDSLHHLIDWHLESKTDGIVILGTTGESPTIDLNEREQIIKKTLDWVGGEVPVIAGTGANSTKETVHLTKQAMELGVDACLIVTPYYNKPTQEGLFQHFKLVAESVPIPQILYNVPSRTACDLLPATVGRLSGIPNIVGIKEATGDIKRISEILDNSINVLDILTGNDDNTLEFIRAGGKGVISVVANVAPRLMHELCVAALAGDFSAAKEINDRLIPLHQQLFIETNPIPVKWAVNQMKKIQAGIRLPLTPLSHDKHSGVKHALNQAGITI